MPSLQRHRHSCFAPEKVLPQWHPTPVLLPGKSHEWRSLVGCSPWGHEELDMTKRFHFHSSLSCTGEGNGNPLQCSCLGNPRDGGAWWAAVYGVAQSWTQLKHLSRSSNDLLSCSLALSGFPGFVALVSRGRNLPPPHLCNDSLLWFTNL